jgi:hypothetical protein
MNQSLNFVTESSAIITQRAHREFPDDSRFYQVILSIDRSGTLSLSNGGAAP